VLALPVAEPAKLPAPALGAANDGNPKETRNARVLRAVARLRALQELPGSQYGKRARATVAAEFGVSERTIGKWEAQAPKLEAQQRRAEVFAGLVAGAGDR
jgi:hypothetical protein